MARPFRPILDRILDRVVVDPDGCWTFTGPTSSSGYGVVGGGGRHAGLVRTHRFMYEHHCGEIPDGLVIDHLCRNKRCCNPAHLEPVTQGENVRRGDRKTRQTHCKRGHEFTPENTRTSTRQRFCIACDRERGRAYRLRKKAA